MSCRQLRLQNRLKTKKLQQDILGADTGSINLLTIGHRPRARDVCAGVTRGLEGARLATRTDRRDPAIDIFCMLDACAEKVQYKLSIDIL